MYGQCRAGAQIKYRECGRGIGHVTPTIFGSTVGYPSDSLASCYVQFSFSIWKQQKRTPESFDVDNYVKIMVHVT